MFSPYKTKQAHHVDFGNPVGAWGPDADAKYDWNALLEAGAWGSDKEEDKVDQDVDEEEVHDEQENSAWHNLFGPNDQVQKVGSFFPINMVRDTRRIIRRILTQ